MSDRPDQTSPAPKAEPPSSQAASPPGTPASAGGAARPPGATGAAGSRKAPAASPAVAPRETAARASPLGAIALFLVILEGAALGALWAHPRVPAGTEDEIAHAERAASDAAGQAQAAKDALGELRNQIASQAAALDSVRRRLDSMGATPSAAAPGATPSVASDTADLQSLRAALDKANEENREAVASLASAERADIAAVRSATTTAIDNFGARIAALSAKLDQQGQAGERASALAARAERLARLQAAMVALADGRPLGTVPNAPPAVARFADVSPPTAASLVLDFPAAAAATLRASEPATAGRGFFARLWTRAQSAITVREGNHVVLGDPAAGIVSAARERLAAGDLEGAVAVLGELHGAAAEAMDPWRSRAASLVDARAALADMMAHS